MRIHDPLAGWPRTQRTEDGYIVYLNVLPPERIRALRALASIIATIQLVVLFLYSPLHYDSAPVPADVAATFRLAFISMVVLWGTLSLLWLLRLHRIVGRLLFGTRYRLEFDRESRRVNQDFFGIPWTRFCLDEANGFALRLHGKAVDEEEAEKKANRTRRRRDRKRLPRFWRDSYWITFRERGETDTLVSLRGRRQAEQVADRLNLVAQWTLAGGDPFAASSREPSWWEKRLAASQTLTQAVRVVNATLRPVRRAVQAVARVWLKLHNLQLSISIRILRLQIRWLEWQIRRDERRQHKDAGWSKEEARREEEEQRRAGQRRREQQRRRKQSSDDQTGSRGGGRSTLDEALAIFELPEDFNCAALKARYRQLSQKLHPDKQGSSFFMSLLNTAYQVLRKHRGCP